MISVSRFPAALLPLILLACMLGPGAPLAAQNSDRGPDQLRTLSHDELDVIKVLNAQERAWNSGNIEAYTSGYKNGPDTLFLANSINRGFDNILQDYKHNYPNREAMGTLTFSELEPHILDDKYAVVLGRYHLERGKKVGGPATGAFSLVFEKTDQGWKILVAHTN